MVRALIGDVHDPRNHHVTQSVTFGLVVFGVFMVTNALNFALDRAGRPRRRGSLARSARRANSSFPCCPVRSRPARSRRSSPSPTRTSACPCCSARSSCSLIFQYLIVALLRSEDRADQLEARSIQLASLQFGVLTTLDGGARAARPHDRPPRRRGRPLREGAGDRDRLQRGRAGARSHRRPAPRHRQVHAGRTASCTRRSSPTRTGRSSVATRRTGRRSSASSTATARSPTRSSTTTSASTAAATRRG